jgi:basic membrane lipoprotein Med (substrate-binding protein (PBP1-ABC) superfamily)
MDSYFSNSFSIGDGKTTVQSLLQYGADAILPVAGPQTIDTVKEIKAQNSNCVVIGVDTAQENDNTINEKSSFKDAAGNQDIIKFSATKNISSITSQILSLSMAKQATNDQTDVQVGTYGYLTVADIRNRGIEPTKNS